MSSKTLYITIGILAALGVILFVIGFIFIQKDKVPGVGPEIVSDSFPFGKSDANRDIVGKTPTGIIANDGNNIIQTPDAVIGLLRQISTAPVAGATVFARDTKTVIRYIEKQTGHIYEATEAENWKRERISNTTIPLVRRTLWGNLENKLVFQYLDDSNIIKTITASIKEKESDIGTLETAFLTDDIHDITISPDGKNIFYILSLGNTAVGVVAKIDGNGRKQIFESPITEWTARWLDKNTIMLLAKPSAYANGFLYTINSATGNIRKILGDAPGLTALISDGRNKVLFSTSANNSFRTFLYDLKSEIPALFPITTFPEKCAWSADTVTVYCGAPQSIPAGAYPDLWYKGQISFNDLIWKINTETGALSILASPKEDARESIDLTDPMLNKDENIFVFINKKDSTLWSLEIR